MPLTRRIFLAALLAAYGLPRRAPADSSADPAAGEDGGGGTLDLHVHLFGTGDAGTGCRMSPEITRGVQFQGLVFALRLRKAKTMDEGYERVLAEQVRGSGVTRAAILGQDAVYDRQGAADWDRTAFYVPNDYVFEVVARHPEMMIACPSINPDRADATEELARCHEKGARLFKIHPPTQGVELSAPKHREYFRRCADLRMLVLVHTGHEHSAPVISKALAAPERLELALGEGCTVVACHSGSGWETDEPDQLPQFVALLDRYPDRLWGDTAVLGTAGRVRDFLRLLAIPRVRERLLHGSDFPFPPAPRAFAAHIGEAAAERVSGEANWLTRDLELKEALGVGYASAKRAYVAAGAGDAAKTAG